MEQITATEENAFVVAAARATVVLRAGGVIVAPTETVYGLMTLWDNAAGRERILRLKQRPAEKHLQMLAATVEVAVAHGLEANPRLRCLAAAFWPGPLTVVTAGRAGETIGLRVPGHVFLQRLLTELGAPLAATSANRSGEPAACVAAAAVAGLAGLPDLLIDGGEIAGGGEASTVVSIVDSPCRILRPGPVSERALRRVLEAAVPGTEYD